MRNHTVPGNDDLESVLRAFGDDTACTDFVPVHTADYSAKLPVRGPGTTYEEFRARQDVRSLIRRPATVIVLARDYWTGRFVNAFDAGGVGQDPTTWTNAHETIVVATVRDNAWSGFLADPREAR